MNKTITIDLRWGMGLVPNTNKERFVYEVLLGNDEYNQIAYLKYKENHKVVEENVAIGTSEYILQTFKMDGLVVVSEKDCVCLLEFATEEDKLMFILKYL